MVAGTVDSRWAPSPNLAGKITMRIRTSLQMQAKIAEWQQARGADVHAVMLGQT